MQLHAEAESAGEAEHALERALQAISTIPENRPAPRSNADDPQQRPPAARLRAALAVLRAHPGAYATVKAILGGVDHRAGAERADEAIAGWAAMFDGAVGTSAEGSVALYALGDPQLLRAATSELVDFLRAEGLLGPTGRLLDIGCGIGRVEEALASEVGLAVGIDISAAMIAAARQRCAGLRNVRFLQCSGRDLSGFADASFDLVLAIDAFPYLVQSGMALAARHVDEAARVLRPDGRLLIFNFSYRDDIAADQGDVARLAAAAGFDVRRNGSREFALWDGAAFELALGWRGSDAARDRRQAPL